MKVIPSLLPTKCIVACSGGPDSVSLAHWIGAKYADQDFNKKRLVSLLFIDHRTPASKEGYKVVNQLAADLNTVVIEQQLPKPSKCPKDESLEAWWSRQRHTIYNSLSTPILTAHHLDDAVETSLMAHMHGNERTLATRSGNVHRPLLLSTKHDILTYAHANQLGYCVDKSNTEDLAPLRNATRHMLTHTTTHIRDLLYAKERKRINDELP